MNSVAVRPRKKHILRKIILWLLFFVILAALVIFVLIPKISSAITTTYTSYTATIGTISNSLSFSGNISITNYETLTAEGDGTVRQIYVQEEQVVHKNDKLMRLSTGETVKAGFDGNVNVLFVKTGVTVSKNDSLVQVVDFENMEVSIRVDEYDISKISVGQACKVTVKAPDITFDSHITHINRVSSNQGNSAYYTVTVGFVATPNVLPGMQVSVVIPEEEAENVVILNKKALTFAADNSAYVLIKNDSGEYVQQAVKVGVSNDNYIEITEGLQQGDVAYAVANSSTGPTGFAAMFSSFGQGRNSSGLPDMNNNGYNRNNGNRPGYGGNNAYGGNGNFGGGMR